MRELIQHCDYVEFRATKKTKLAQTGGLTEGRQEETIFLRMAFEKTDEKHEAEVVSMALEDIKKFAETVKTKNIVLYPYVHLLYGAEPAGIKASLSIMNSLSDALMSDGFNVMQAPFGWYKEFTMKCKGHPMSELSRILTPTGETTAEGKKKELISQALKAEDTMKSHWYILDTKGKLSPISMGSKGVTGYTFKDKNLEKFAKHEISKKRDVDQEPPHVGLMQKLEIADYEPASDPGNIRFYPKGRLIKSLLETYVTQKVTEYGAMEIESPIMYDADHPTLKAYINRFPARQYRVESPNKDLFLRFAACLGQFLMTHDATFSYKDLPLRLYELTRYSFRVEKRGELTGLRRLRAFTMPDSHAFCADFEQAKEELIIRFELTKEVQKGIGLNIDNLQLGLNMVKSFYTEHKDFVHKMVKDWGRPALVEIWDEQFFYFVFKIGLNFIDNLDKAANQSTDQIDIENGKAHGITFTDKDGKKKHPLLLHLSPSGAIERAMYALLEQAALDEKAGKNPSLPLWLAPTQIRFCPVSDKFNKDCEALADKLSKQNIRVDIDDRQETIGKKVRDSEIEWIPYTIVYGDKEKKSKTLSVRYHKDGKVKQLDPQQLILEIQKITQGMPFRPINLPRNLSKRPIFRG